MKTLLLIYVTRSWQQIKSMTKHPTEDIVWHFSTSFLGNRRLRYKYRLFHEKAIHLVDFTIDHHLYLSCIKLHSRNISIYESCTIDIEIGMYLNIVNLAICHIRFFFIKNQIEMIIWKYIIRVLFEVVRLCLVSLCESKLSKQRLFNII